MKKELFFNLLSFFGLVLFLPLFGEQMYSPNWGYGLDLPENFELISKEENKRYLFKHSMLPVDLQIALYEKAEYVSIDKINEHVFLQLNIEHKDIPFQWRDKNASFSSIKFSYSLSKNYKSKNLVGWLLVLELPKEKGFLVLMTYTEESKAKKCETLMISVLDTVFTDEGSNFIPGPITTALYPKTEIKEVDLVINEKNISFKVNNSDIEANKFVIDREFQLLTLYLNKKTIFRAWKRFYRTIFRDAWERVLPFTFAFQSFINDPVFNETKYDSKKVVDKLLAFVQSFKYVRDHSGSDFINLPQAILDKTGDCDVRALLMTLVLKQMNIDAILLISPNKHHSIVAVDCLGPGARFNHNGKQYLMAETTTHDKAGKIDKSIMSPQNWFPVDFFVVE